MQTNKHHNSTLLDDAPHRHAPVLEVRWCGRSRFIAVLLEESSRVVIDVYGYGDDRWWMGRRRWTEPPRK